MPSDLYCAGCHPLIARGECVGSFERLGILKVHWECWSNCNLSCAFCYRTLGVPLDTDSAKRLLQVVHTSGAKAFVFAGGDPSLRMDIGELIEYGIRLGLQVEVQTNAHNVRHDFLNALKRVNLVGLSLDGPTAEIHDCFRGKNGNFVRVLRTLAQLEEIGIPVVVRTIIAKPNCDGVPKIPDVLNRFTNVVRWSLLEFSAAGEGYTNRKQFELGSQEFDDVASIAQNNFIDPAKVNIYRSRDKLGTYALVTPNGYLYGTTQDLISGTYPLVGSVLEEHVSYLAQKLPFSIENHQDRYIPLLSRSSNTNV